MYLLPILLLTLSSPASGALPISLENFFAPLDGIVGSRCPDLTALDEILERLLEAGLRREQIKRYDEVGDKVLVFGTTGELWIYDKKGRQLNPVPGIPGRFNVSPDKKIILAMEAKPAGPDAHVTHERSDPPTRVALYDLNGNKLQTLERRWINRFVSMTTNKLTKEEHTVAQIEAVFFHPVNPYLLVAYSNGAWDAVDLARNDSAATAIFKGVQYLSSGARVRSDDYQIAGDFVFVQGDGVGKTPTAQMINTKTGERFSIHSGLDFAIKDIALNPLGMGLVTYRSKPGFRVFDFRKNHPQKRQGRAYYHTTRSSRHNDLQTFDEAEDIEDIKWVDSQHFFVLSRARRPAGYFYKQRLFDVNDVDHPKMEYSYQSKERANISGRALELNDSVLQIWSEKLPSFADERKLIQKIPVSVLLQPPKKSKSP